MADVFGVTRTVGFYNTFAATAGPVDGALVSADGIEVNALRGSGFESIQFHPESILSTDGIEILSELVHRLLMPAGVPVRTVHAARGTHRERAQPSAEPRRPAEPRLS